MSIKLQDKYNKLFIFDFETTGINPNKDNIIEMGAIILRLNPLTNKYDQKDEIDYLVKIDYNIPDEIVKLTNITDEMLEKEGISELELFNIIKQIVDEKTLVIAYNIQFDMSFLNALLKKYLGNNYVFPFDILDCMAMYKDFFAYPHRLESAIETFNIDASNSHRACDDCFATYLVFKEMCNVIIRECLANKLPKEEALTYYLKYINHLGYNPKYPVTNKLRDDIIYTKQYGAGKEIFNYKGVEK